MAFPTRAAMLGSLVLASPACTNDFEGLSLGTAGAGAAASASGTGAGASGAGGSQGGSTSSTSGQAGAGASMAGSGGAGNSGGVEIGGAGSGGNGGQPLASCLDQYGEAPFYETCVESELVCEFFTTFAGTTSCSAFCAAHGGKCSTVYNQGAPGNRCVYDTVTQYACDGNWNNMICVCTRGCGGEPACTGRFQCDGTNCI